jgi:hypothetical protein
MSYYEAIKIDTVNNYYLYSSEEIDALGKRLAPEKLSAFKSDMEDLFDWKLESVASKEKPAPSGDPRDYVSLATYWWPNAETAGGLPYIRKDGLVNPEGARYDKDKLKRLAYLAYHGGLLYLLCGEDRYLTLIEKHLRNWFINEETRMNPHLEYGQFIPGMNKGRAEGLIDYGASFSYALNMLRLLKTRKALAADLLEGLDRWHSSFRTWLLESEIGKTERAAKNNHGTFYDISLCVIERFLGMDITGRAEFFVRERIEKQIAADCSLPQETARTRSLCYSFMGLKGLLEGAKLFREGGVDLFPRLKASVDWLYKAAIVRREDWPFPQVTPFDEGSYLLFRELVSNVYAGQYRDIADYIDPAKIDNKVLDYLYWY